MLKTISIDNFDLKNCNKNKMTSIYKMIMINYKKMFCYI